MFERELNFFKENQADFVKKYNGKILVIVGDELVGVHDNLISAYKESLNSYKLGSFMIQPCVPGPSAYTVTISPSIQI